MTALNTEPETDKTEDSFPDLPGKLTREELLKITGGVITHLKPKATGGRMRDQDLEKLRDAKMRLLLEACKVHASVLKDEQMDNIESRLKILEERIK